MTFVTRVPLLKKKRRKICDVEIKPLKPVRLNLYVHQIVLPAIFV